jgi:hypothetical protein
MRQYKEKNINETGENQSTLQLLNKKASVSSDILVGHVTSSQNESVLSKYLIVHE